MVGTYQDLTTQRGQQGQMAVQMAEEVGQFKSGEKRFDLGDVKLAHMLWRGRLRALLAGAIELRLDEVASHHDCDFGKWYDAQNDKSITEHPAYREVGEKHQWVHEIAADVVGLVERGEKDRAVERFKAFEPTRIALFEALDKLYME